MKKNYLWLPVVALSLSLTPMVSSCNDNDTNGLELNSYYNGVYSGAQLEVTVDNQKNTSVTAATVKVGTDSQGTLSLVDVTLNDFPTSGEDHKLQTRLDNQTIEGTTNLDGKTYTFSVKIKGEYGADADKSCKIVFSSQE